MKIEKMKTNKEIYTLGISESMYFDNLERAETNAIQWWIFYSSSVERALLCQYLGWSEDRKSCRIDLSQDLPSSLSILLSLNEIDQLKSVSHDVFLMIEKECEKQLVSSEPSKSKGHIEFLGKYEYFMRAINGKNQLYRSPITYPVQRNGFRCGRWQTTEKFADEYMDNIRALTKGE